MNFPIHLQSYVCITLLPNMHVPEQNFSKQAGIYAQYRPDYPGSMICAIQKLCEEHSLCWDSATGNGQAAVALAQYFNKVIGTDISKEQLANAVPHEKIEYRQMASEQTNLIAQSVNLITVAQALHWFHFENFYREVRRVAKTNAIICAWGYGLHSLENKPANELLWKFYSDIVGPYWPAGREHIESGYSTIPFPFEKISLADYTMEREWNFQEYLGYLHTWSAVQRYKDKRGTDPVEYISGKFAELWGNLEHKQRIHFPIFTLCGRII